MYALSTLAWAKIWRHNEYMCASEWLCRAEMVTYSVRYLYSHCAHTSTTHTHWRMPPLFLRQHTIQEKCRYWTVGKCVCLCVVLKCTPGEGCSGLAHCEFAEATSTFWQTHSQRLTVDCDTHCMAGSATGQLDLIPQLCQDDLHRVCGARSDAIQPGLRPDTVWICVYVCNVRCKGIIEKLRHAMAVK